jgi:glycosyltransferase involved in cell wall biosynthesis
MAERFDFFITTGIADPNPTTILESMAWGFPVICTPQSGYYETAYLRNVHHEDMGRSVATLRELQFAPEEDLRQMADEARKAAETDYNWEKFVSTIFSTLHID